MKRVKWGQKQSARLRLYIPTTTGTTVSYP